MDMNHLGRVTTRQAWGALGGGRATEPHVYVMTALFKDLGATTAGQSAAEDESATDDASVGSSNEWEDIPDYFCIKHGVSMTIDSVVSRDLRTCRDQEPTMLRVGFCKLCNEDALRDGVRDKRANATPEKKDRKVSKDSKENDEAKRHECEHLETCRGANQYGRWTICRQCGVRLSYESTVQGYPKPHKNKCKETTGTSSTPSTSTTPSAWRSVDQDKIAARRKELKEKLAAKEGAKEGTQDLPSREPLEHTSNKQARYIMLLCSKLGIQIDVPRDRIEASALIADLRSEVDVRDLWK
jgi:hypothetical protein